MHLRTLLGLLILLILFASLIPSQTIVQSEDNDKVLFLVEAIQDYEDKSTSSTTNSGLKETSELKYIIEAANKFIEVINSKTDKVSFTLYTNDEARPRHWWIKSFSAIKQDADIVSNYHYAMFLGHGQNSQFIFSQKDETTTGRVYDYTDLQGIVYGGNTRYIMMHPTNNTRWLTFFSCRTLYLGNKEQFENVIRTTFTGSSNPGYLLDTYLHGIVGSATIMYDWHLSYIWEIKDSVNTMEAYANYLSQGYSFRNAWFKAVTEKQPSDVKPAVIYINIRAYNLLTKKWKLVYTTKDEGMEPFSPAYYSPKQRAEIIMNQGASYYVYYVEWIYEVYNDGGFTIESKLNPHPPTKTAPSWTPPQPAMILPIMIAVSVSNNINVRNIRKRIIAIVLLSLISFSPVTPCIKTSYVSIIVKDIENLDNGDKLWNSTHGDIIFKYSGKPLDSLLNKKLYLLPIGCIRTKAEKGCYDCDTFTSGISFILDNIKIDLSREVKRHGLIFTSKAGKLVINEMIGDGKRNIIIQYIEYDKATWIITSIGYFYHRIKDVDNSSSLYVLGENFTKTLASIMSSSPRLVLRLGVPYKLVYGGISGSIMQYIYRAPVNPNNSAILWNGSRFEVKYLYPYEKYYILIGDDIRLGYPIKIAVKVNGSYAYIERLEGLIPIADGTLVKEDIKTFTLTGNYLKKVIHIINNVTGSNVSSLKQLVIGDIYYTVYNEYKYLAPLLILVYNGYSIHLYLTPEGPVVETAGKLLGPISSYIPSDDSLREFKKYLEEEINSALSKKRTNIGLFIPITDDELRYLLLIILSSILILGAIILYKHYAKKR